MLLAKACADGVAIPKTRSFLSALKLLAIKAAFAIVPSAFFSSNSALIPASSNAFLNPSLARSKEGCVTICVIPIL